jgi:hypothetical protein
MAINSEFTAGQVLTAAQQNALPFGIVGITNLTSAFSSASTSVVAITGLSVTFTAVANRRYLIVLMHSAFNSASGITQTYICNGTTILNEARSGPLSTQTYSNVQFFVQTPGAGSVTYNARMNVTSGTSTFYDTGTNGPLACRIMVLDVGNA